MGLAKLLKMTKFGVSGMVTVAVLLFWGTQLLFCCGISSTSMLVIIFVVHSASGAEAGETSAQTTNPMVKLFCGQFLSAGINEGMILSSLLLILIE